METPETRKKLADGIRALQAQGDTETIDRLVSAYKVKYKSDEQAPTQPVTPPKQPGFVQGLAQSIASPFLKTASTIYQGGAGIKNLAEMGIAKLRGDEGDYQKQSREFDVATDPNAQYDFGYLGKAKPVGSIKEAAGVGMEAAATFLPVGKVSKLAKLTLGGKVAQSAKLGAQVGLPSGALTGLGQSLQDDAGVGETIGRTALGGALGTVGGAVLGGAAPVAANVFRKLPGVIKSPVASMKQVLPQPENIMNRVARLSPTEAQRFKQMTGESHGNYLQRTGNFGTPEEIVEKEAIKFSNSLKNTDEAIATLPGVHKSPHLDTVLDDLVKREAEIGVRSPDTDIIKNLYIKNQTHGLTMPEINQAKRIYERTVKLGYAKERNTIGIERSTRLDNSLRGWQFRTANQLGLKNLPELNKQTQASKFIINKLGGKLAGQTGNNAISLTDWIVLSGGDPTAISAFLAKRLFLNKRVQAGVAKRLAGTPESPIQPEFGLRPEPPKQLPPPSPLGSPQRPIVPKAPTTFEKAAPKGGAYAERKPQLLLGTSNRAPESQVIRLRPETKTEFERGVIPRTNRKTPPPLKLSPSRLGKPLPKQLPQSPTKGKTNLGITKDLSQEAKILRGTKGMTADDIVKTYPNIKLTKDVPATDIYGNKKVIPDGEKLTPYELKGNKVLLQDGETYIVSKNQFQNIKGNSVGGEAKPFAPELQGLEETVKGTSEDVIADLQAKGRTFERGTPEYVKIQNQIEDIRNKKVETKYSQYQLPEGKNYKEILIKAPESVKQLPSDVKIVKRVVRGKDEYWVERNNNLLGRGKTEELAKADAQKTISSDSQFKSSHWDEPNVISHLRMNERTYKGKKVAFMEELQSDWAREARKDAELLKDKPADKYGDFSRVPQNPNLKNWQELSVKRALKEAVDNKSEYFAWINGEQTSARYNLATHVDNVKWGSSGSSKYPNRKLINIKAKDVGESVEVFIDEKGIVTNSDKGDWKGKKLDEVLGKGLADKIMEKETGTLAGEGLKFGGEWAGNLYDKQVRDIVQKLTGGKVEMIDMGLPIDGKKHNWVTGANNAPLTEAKLKIGNTFRDGGNTHISTEYIITDILGEGKFKAVPKSRIPKEDLKDFNKFGVRSTAWDEYAESFDISSKTTQQQAIRLTPEIRAKIRGEALEIKTSGEKFNTVFGRPPKANKKTNLGK